MMFGCAKNLNESKKKLLAGGNLYQHYTIFFPGDHKELVLKIIQVTSQMTAKIYTGDIGTIITVDAQDPDASAINLTGMTLTLDVWKPGATSSVSWAGTISGTTSITYTTVSGDWDLAGEYRIQAKVVDGTKVWRGTSYRFDVHALGT